MATLDSHTWEQPLLSLARDAWYSVACLPRSVADAAALERAYAHCEAITAAHSRSFYLATRLLPYAKRRAIRALYAFCRVTDNLVDCPERDAAEALSLWRRRALSPEPGGDPVATAWADTRARYHIPLRLAEQLIDGVARDLRQTHYTTFDELAAYAYGAASTVGLMSMRIIGYTSADALPYAVKLGVALQLTNILRDVGEDWRAGRVYLPARELAAFGLSQDELAAGRVDDRWRAFMRFQIERNRRLYAEAWPGIALLKREGRLAVAAAGALYRAILSDIEAHDYDVFSRRAQVSGGRKLLVVAGVWWRNR